MAGTALAPSEARRAAEASIDEMQRKAVEHLHETGGETSLGELLRYLVARGATGTVVSQALSNLLNEGRIELTRERLVRLR